MKEENDLLKAQSLSAKEKEDVETWLAKAESEASFNLAKKTKAEEKMKEIKDKLKDDDNCANQDEYNILIKDNQIQNTEKMVKDLEEEKVVTATFLKAVQSENRLLASKVLQEIKEDTLRIEEEKVKTFEIRLLLALDHANKSTVGDQINWTNI